MADGVRIKDLQRTTEADDNSIIAIDNGNVTYGIKVSDFNANANASAYQQAQAAAASAQTATDKADLASGYATTASGYVTQAQNAVSSAQAYKEAAEAQAALASGYATTASGYATDAQGYAADAAAAVTEAASQADTAEAWAIGQSNSAKYWASVAEGVAGGGVSAFNGRSGAVIPLAGDYAASMVTYGTGSVADKLGSLDNDIDAVEGSVSTLSTTVSGKMDAKTIDSTPTSGNTGHLADSGGIADAISTAVAGKMDAKTIDSSPTSGNTDHLVSSAGVYTAVENVATTAASAITAANAAVKYTDLVNAGTQTTAGQKALDAVYGKTLADGKVNKSGDTMSGTLVTEGTADVGIDAKCTEITDGTTPSSNKYPHGLQLKESAGKEYGRFRGIYRTNGELGVQVEAARTVNGSTKYNTVNLTLNDSGDPVVAFANNGAAAWRNALQVLPYNNSIDITPVVSGYVTSGQKQLAFFVPYPLFSGTSISISSLSMAVRAFKSDGTGEYPYARSGSEGTAYTQLGASRISVWSNGASTRTNEVSSLTATLDPGCGITVSLNFTYALTSDTSGTAIVNNVPFSARINLVATIS